MTRTLTTAAQAAKAIKAELKEKFPNTKFSVKSQNFSMGNSVDVRWFDGATMDEVNDIIKKYQYGSFDGMIDLYEITNDRDDIPQAKYVLAQRDYSYETVLKAVDEHNSSWDSAYQVKAVKSDYSDRAWVDGGYTVEGQAGQDAVNRKLRETSF